MIERSRRASSITYECQCCHTKVDLTFFNQDDPMVKRMRTSLLCNECLFWTELFDRNPPHFIVNQEYWVYGERMYESESVGQTPTRAIMYPDKSVMRVSYPYCVGKIPPQFLDDHPDDAIFLPILLYHRAYLRHQRECRAVGCYDRYYCFWYDANQLEANGPWNVIPEDHIIGSEKCSSFINKNELKNDECYFT